jgi:catechol 2,3-dioxygenase-like lactoylglutathione lyase family enzyme
MNHAAGMAAERKPAASRRRNDMALGLDHPITDICLLVQDLDRSIPFYEKLGFRLRRRNPGFADFDAAGTTLALWESRHVAEHVGFSADGAEKPVHKVMTAFRVDSPAIVHAVYDELTAKGVPVLARPKTYEWNATCLYFSDPDGNTWEVYAWHPAGPYDAGVPPKNR